MAIAAGILTLFGIDPGTPAPGDPGAELENATRRFLGDELCRLDPGRAWILGRQSIIEFAQYEHLARLHKLAQGDATLRTELGSDYLIRPDITVGVGGPSGTPFLHAAVSCKWTIRSDRVQNIRHEGIIMSRHRRGRQPHIVAVTAEPLPSRIASIARGTGEIDAVYHICLDELAQATQQSENTTQEAVLEELVGQQRLRSLADLPLELVAF